MKDFSHIDDEFVDRCIKSGELQLTKDERWSHFLPVTYLVIAAISFAAFGIYKIIEKIFSGELILSDFGIILGSLFFILASYLSYRMQKNALQFFIIRSDSLLSKKYKIVNSVGKKLNWKKVFEKDNIIIGKTPFNFSSWGEQITVIFYQDKVLVNSICDPDKKTSIYGPNHKNINAFFYKFEAAKQKRIKEISE